MNKTTGNLKNRMMTAFLALLCAASLVTASLAWYRPLVADFGDTEISGTIRASYFEHGTGTADDPYIIARPVQLYNFTWLQYLGYLTNDDGTPVYVQLLDKDSYSGENKTTAFLNDDGDPAEDGDVLDMTGYELPPVGKDDANAYSGNFNGNGKTISNLTVCSTVQDVTSEDSADTVTVCDVGFFGFVTSDASISDLYLDNLTIDLTGASTASLSSHEGYRSVTEKDAAGVHTVSGTDVCYVGYIAGHIEDPDSFEDVYVNNCTISGGTTAHSNYGYFGYAEDAASVSTTTADTVKTVLPGDDYEFHMTAQDLYYFLNEQSNGGDLTKYTTQGSSFSSETLVTRNDAVTSGGTDLSYKESDGATLSTALSYSSSAWVLDGSYPRTLHYRDSSNTNLYNFSFSKIGYSGADSYYQLYYKDGDSYTEVPSTATISTSAPAKNPDTGDYLYYDGSKYVYYQVTEGYTSEDNLVSHDVYYIDGSDNVQLTESAVTITTTAPKDCETVGSYIYYDTTNKKWVYYECTQAAVTPANAEMTFNTANSYSLTTQLGTTFYRATSYTYSAALYVDNVNVSTKTGNLTRSGSSGNYTLALPQITFDAVTLESGSGHHYAIIVTLNVTGRTSRNESNSNLTYYYYGGSLSGTTVSETEFTVPDSDSAQSISLTYAGTSGLSHSGTSFTSQKVSAEYTSYDLEYLNAGGTYTALKDSSLDDDFAYDSNKWTVSINEPFETDAVYTGPYTTYYTEDDGESYTVVKSAPTQSSSGAWQYLKSGSVYLSDLFEDYVNPVTGNTTGYSSDNIDLVGWMSISETRITPQGYQGDTYNLTSSDFGKTFYGNAVNGGSDCIVVKIKNEDSDTLGTFDICYEATTGDIQFTRGSLTTPGNGSTSTVIGKSYTDGMSASTSTTYSATNSSGTTVYAKEATITKENIVNCAYCGIDESGKIIAIPNIDTSKAQASADQGGFVYQDGKDINDVAYFVMLMGFTAGGQNNYIYRVDFAFEADNGDGGTGGLDASVTQLVSETKVFDTIDYRSASDTREYSLLNVEFVAPETGSGETFTYTIGYDKDTKNYTITINNTASESLAMSVLLSDDDDDLTNEYPYSYTIVYNGTTVVANSKISYNFTALPAGIIYG